MPEEQKTVFGKVLFKAVPKKDIEFQPIITLTNPQFRISGQITFQANAGWQEVEITNQDDWTSVFVAYGWDKLKNLPQNLTQKYEAGIYPVRLVLDSEFTKVGCCGGSRSSIENNTIFDIYWQVSQINNF